MKPIKASRFTKKRPEKISFQGGALLENPKPKKQAVAKKKADRTNKRTDKPSNVRTNQGKKNDGIFRYRIELPRSRRKVRHSFDIFEDQKAALGKLQLAIAEETKIRPSFGKMVQEAIDLYTKEKAKQLNNAELIS